MSSTADEFTRLDQRARDELLRVARHALEHYLGRGEEAPVCASRPELAEPRAAFVTLRQRVSNELRGCRGETQPTRALVQAVAKQAISAATRDHRFTPVTFEELPEIAIHISALGPLRPIEPQDIELGRHGLLIARDGHSGLLLPQVPALYDVATVPDFLEMLCHKAGLPEHSWNDPETELLAFEAQSWGERDDDES